MRKEVWMDDYTGNVTLVLFDFKGTKEEIKAIYYCDENYEAELMERFNELDADPMAYFGWKSGYNQYTVWRASEVDRLDKYDEEGEEVDLEEHPWTLEELYKWMTDCSMLQKPYYVYAIDRFGDERTVGKFYIEENAKGFARGFALAWKGEIEIRQYDNDIEDDDWDGCMDHETIEWKEPPRLDGRNVRIVFDDGETADILGEITLAENGRIHIRVIEN